MRAFVTSIEGECRRYKLLGDGSIGQLGDDELTQADTASGNSVATIVWHISGNLVSRFTDFLTSDGEKPSRDRESEFAPRSVTAEELEDRWERGWHVLFATLETIDDGQLEETVTIRGTTLKVHEALHRSLAHTAYHVGQIVFLAKAIRGAGWRWLTIPPGGTEAYNKNPVRERAPGPSR